MELTLFADGLQAGLLFPDLEYGKKKKGQAAAGPDAVLLGPDNEGDLILHKARLKAIFQTTFSQETSLHMTSFVLLAAMLCHVTDFQSHP